MTNNLHPSTPCENCPHDYGSHGRWEWLKEGLKKVSNQCMTTCFLGGDQAGPCKCPGFVGKETNGLSSSP